jgi:hypothetical protein
MPLLCLWSKQCLPCRKLSYVIFSPAASGANRVNYMSNQFMYNPRSVIYLPQKFAYKPCNVINFCRNANPTPHKVTYTPHNIVHLLNTAIVMPYKVM